MTSLRDMRTGIAEKLVNGLPTQPYVYRTPMSVAHGPAICVEPAEPRSAKFNTSNAMGDEWYFRIWVMVPVVAEVEMAYDELDELVYGESGARRVLHFDDTLDDGSPLTVDGVREYGQEVSLNSQRWVSAQVMVTVHTRG